MQKITLNLIPDGVPPVVYVNQFDTGREFQISFKEGLSPYNFPSGVVFRINGRKADNHVFEYTESDKWDASHNIITKSGSGTSLIVTIATSEQMTAAAGDAEVQLTFKSSSASNDILGTLNFILAVQEQPYANGDPSGSEFPEIIAMATEQMLNSEAWAVGEKDGVPVASTEPQYHNNSSYYAQRARTSASSAANSNTMAAVSASAAATSASNAATSETNAAASEAAAEDAATRAEAVEAHPPRLDPPGVTPNGNWWVWDNTLNPPAYKDSGVDAGVSCDVDPNTVTLPAGSSAAVQNTGTQTDPRFKFSIPQGAKGDKGDKGDTGATGATGAKGDKGDTGPVGPAGDIADIEEAVGWVGSNLFEGLDTVTGGSGITVTRQNDGKYLVSGTRTDTGGKIYRVGKFLCKAGVEYKVSGCPTGGGTFWLGCYQPGTGISYGYGDTGNGMTLTAFAQDTEIELGIRIPEGYVCPANFLWSPMISRNGGEYVPYHPTVQEELWDGEVAEPKNLIKYRADLPKVYTENTVTFTVNDDYSVTVNTSAPTTADVRFGLTYELVNFYPDGKYVLSDVNGSNNGVYTTVWRRQQAGTAFSNLGTNDAQPCPFTVNNADKGRYMISLYVKSGKTVNNVTLYPMICTEEDWNKSHAYSPYYVPLKDVVPTKFNSSNVAPTEDGVTASQAYSTGQYLIHNGELRKATTSIASGAAITNNNTDAITLAEILERNKNEHVSGIVALTNNSGAFDISNGNLDCVINRFTRRISIRFDGVVTTGQIYVKEAKSIITVASGYYGLINPMGQVRVYKDNVYYRAQLTKNTENEFGAFVALENIPVGATVVGYIEWPY